MNLGVQYYRPPFPDNRYWEEDFARIKDAGLDTVQLWVVWGWVEPTPGQWRFEDYDELVALAEKHELGVVLSTIAEIHPCWIHREVPGSEMIDHMGRKVVSSGRCECHFGITPGGCTDHPGVWDRMSEFLERTVTRYAGTSVLRGWDAWNELRWNEQSDGFVCFCEHTLKAFREWLDAKYGGLDGLNRAWVRRYGLWEDVFPGKLPDRPYTEMMAFEHFLTLRASKHARMRYDVMKALDPHRPVTVHGGEPAPLYSGAKDVSPIDRGNDWFNADHLDGVGCSSFPKWFGVDDADFGMRMEFVKSAAREKQVWLSEVQGGRTAVGFRIYDRVDPDSQQRWIWNGLACGADMILFWCWRDEVFGRESAGFGIAGDDGLADERLAAMRKTSKLLADHRDMIAGYEPHRGQVGVLFSPQAYYLAWAQEGVARNSAGALKGYCRALVRKSIPYVVVEEEHLDELDGLKVLFMPRSIVVDAPTEQRLAEFVNSGGTIVCESECGAFASNGIYRYGEDRFLARLAGISEVGRRKLNEETIRLTINGVAYDLEADQWVTPSHRGGGEVWAEHEDGALAQEIPVGKGRVVLLGSYFGDTYYERNTVAFENFLDKIVHLAGVQRSYEVVSSEPAKNSFVYVRTGQSNGKKMVFVFFPQDIEEAELRFHGKFFTSGQVREIIGGEDVKVVSDAIAQTCHVSPGRWRLAVLVEC